MVDDICFGRIHIYFLSIFSFVYSNTTLRCI
jgi:hypothetical protein